jgi:hypothetical protein
MGRGGRIFIDRTGYNAPVSGKIRPGASEKEINAMKRYKFDTDMSDDDDMVVDEMQDR